MNKAPSKNKIHQFNLATLIQEHKGKGPAAKGYKKLVAAINKNKEEELRWLLRDHEVEGVYLQNELNFRYEVDYLIKYYSLLQLAVITDYIPAKFPKEIREEIITVLGHPAVEKYYEKYYPLYLPQVILKAAKKNSVQKVFGPPSIFRELLMLDYKEDTDMEAFLFLLDGFEYEGKNIDDLNRLLNSESSIKRLLQKQRKDESRFEQAFWGFIKHNDFMLEYRLLLQKCEDDTLRSAIWHFRGYWFKNMKALMRDKYIQGIKNIKEMTDKVSPTEYKKNSKIPQKPKRQPDEKIDHGKSYIQWKKESDKQINEVYKTVRYNLNPSHSKALLGYMRAI